MELLAGTQLIRMLAALVLVLGLMLGLNLLLRRIQGNTIRLKTGPRRLQIVESIPLDSRRRAILLRRDGREHLVILGATGETVVETGIIPAQDQTSHV